MNKAMQNIGIIGEGKMGSNIFYYLLDFGFTMTGFAVLKLILKKSGRHS